MPAKNDTYPCHQIIDENQEFSDELSTVIEQKWELSEAKLDYHVVSIFGSRYTAGKTCSQTTQSIWMSRATQLPILLIDVQGPVGPKSNKDQDFESKAALFALTTTEVLIFDLREPDLFTNSTISMLENVIQAYLRLFQNPKGARQKTLIITIIRDNEIFGQAPPFKEFKENLNNIFNNIWRTLDNKATITTPTIDDFFDFMFFNGSRDPIFSSEQFIKDVTNLQERFIDPTTSDYVFQPQYHKQIPIDGYHKYVSDIWTQICLNKSLDLSTQQKLLSELRCDEISNDVLKRFEKRFDLLLTRTLEKDDIISDLGYRMRTLQDNTINEYQTRASCYLSEIYQEKEKKLLEKINAKLHVLFDAQLKFLHIKAIKMFEYELKVTIFNGSLPLVDDDTKGIIVSRRSLIETNSPSKYKLVVSR
ncbi:hypothetical protein INT45_005022 [Circinella minor]|uniref:Sey1/RHD3-like three-helix bundle domain-containing protein n=1 Tax=Circinella minor TaxID=1195481 RepID=A0A8H7VFW7_9FUNG|nr:hypothetical protein INT45_005022 [Circinella minor]